MNEYSNFATVEFRLNREVNDLLHIPEQTLLLPLVPSRNLSDMNSSSGITEGFFKPRFESVPTD